MKDDREYCCNGELGVVVCHVVPSFGNVTFERHSCVSEHISRLVDGVQHVVSV